MPLTRIGIALLGLLLAACRPASAASQPSQAKQCAVTPAVIDQPPDDPNADPFGSGPWLINAERTIWAHWGAGWAAGAQAANKVIWIRPAGADLQLSGHRLDGDAPPMEASIPQGYHTGFQVTGLHFPTAGCWAVTAQAGDERFEFVVAISDHE